MSREVREENVKKASKILEACKTHLRRMREETIKDAKKMFKKDIDYQKYLEKEVKGRFVALLAVLTYL
jgi:ribosome recycling factor